MNKQQKHIIYNFILILVITTIAVVAMLHFKDWVNRSEAVRAFTALGADIQEYREQFGSIPPQSYVDRITEDIPGSVRIGELNYRARWIGPNAEPNQILAYARKDYRGTLMPSGYIVLKLDGTVEWMSPEEFRPLLKKQQTQSEIEFLQ